MSKAIQDIDDPRLVKALAHPMRMQILGILERGSASPKEMAGQLGVPIENLSYHVRTLRDFGFIELERTRPVRGTIERYYRAVARPRITAQAWERLPTIIREALEAATLDQIFDVVGRAAEEKKLDRAEAQIQSRRAVLDEQGFAEASEAVSQLLDRLTEIEKGARTRLKRSHGEEVPAVVVAMLFDAPAAEGDRKSRSSSSKQGTRKRKSA